MARIAFLTFYDTECIGIRIIASYLQKHGHECSIILHEAQRIPSSIDQVLDFPKSYQFLSDNKFHHSESDFSPIGEDTKEAIVDKLRQLQPDIIGISTRSYLDDFCVEFSQQLKSNFPDSLIIAGGFGPTLSPEKYLDKVDIVIRGDGEEACLELANCVDEHISWKHIKNLVFNSKSEIIFNPLNKPERNLSKYPWPLRNSKNIFIIKGTTIISEDKRMIQHRSMLREYIIIWGRGCSGTCSYCSGGNWRKIYQDENFTLPPRRLRETDDVIKELQNAKSNGFTSVHILDEFLVAPVNELKYFFEQYKEKVGLPFTCYLHPQIMLRHPDIFKIIISAGLISTTIGIQTGSESFAENVYNRKNNNKEILRYANFLHNHKIKFRYHLIGGNSLENDTTFKETLEFVRELPFVLERNKLYYFYFAPFPKSPIVEKYGWDTFNKRNSSKWLKQGYTLFLRFLLDDAQFSKVAKLQTASELKIYSEEMIKKGQNENIDKVLNKDKTFKETIFYQTLAEHIQGEEVYIWGSGSCYQSNKHLIKGCHIAACFDNDPTKHNTLLDSTIPICSPQELLQLPARPIFIFSAFKDQIVDQIHELGLDLVIP